MSSSTDRGAAAIHGDGAARADGAGAGLGAAEGASRGIAIEDVREPDRLKGIEELQRLAWGMEERGIVPASLLQIAATGGGILLAAYDRAGQTDPGDHGDRGDSGDAPVGFVFGLLARRGDGRLYHASHMLATDPRYQGRGVGAALKWAQRARALEQGLDLMTWTFDPLIARNAHVNLHKLGAVCRTYYEDYYGPMDDQYNRGLPTDRLLVEWRLRDATTPPEAGEAPVRPVPLLVDEGGVPALRIDRLEAEGGRAPLSVGIPGDMAPIKEGDPAAALAWRFAVRRALSWAFARGYAVRDFAGGAYLLVPGDTRQ